MKTSRPTAFGGSPAVGGPQRIGVRVAYRLHGQPALHQLDFVARIADAAQASADGFELAARAKRAVCRRHQVPAAAVAIAGVESY